MSQEAFLRNSAFIQELLHSASSDTSSLPKEHIFGIVKYSLGSWIKTGAVMASGYFAQGDVVTEEDDPIIEPLEDERDDEAVTPTPEQLAEADEAALESDMLPDQDRDPEPDDLAAIAEAEAEPEPDHSMWEPVEEAIDQYFSFINRLVLFSPEMHKNKWRNFTEEAESILKVASLTPQGLATRFKLVESLYRETTVV